MSVTKEKVEISFAAGLSLVAGIIIVIGARGMGFPKELFFGSTSNFVLHKARAPVTIVK